MRVLFLHENRPDYLAESLFHGLRSLLGSGCVDVPRYDSLYAPLRPRLRAKLRGHGFTLYGLLEEIPELADERFYWRHDLGQYDLIVVADIWAQWQTFWELVRHTDPAKIAVLDGADTAAFFPYASRGWRLRHVPWSYLTPLARCKYFKREMADAATAYGLDDILPRALHPLVQLRRDAIPIGFSIPEEKIKRVAPDGKTKRFPAHIVDEEVAAHVNGSFAAGVGSTNYAFDTEEGYYDDLRSSFYGITMKRAGWDCLRHYELAANGCVLCFRDLDSKPNTCAPHGLDESNCVPYGSYDELERKLASITKDDYGRLLGESYRWVTRNTTRARAEQFLAACSQA